MSGLSESLLVYRLAELVKRAPASQRPVALFAEGAWAGGASVQAGGTTWTLRQARSPLAMRVCLNEPVVGRLVVLTDLDVQALGADVLARLEEQRVFEVRPWAVLMERFQATAADARIQTQGLTQTLLELSAPEGFEPAPGGYLDLDLAWQTLLRHGLGFEAGTLDLPGALAWLLGPGRARSLTLGASVRQGLMRHLAGQLGAGGALALGLADERGVDWPARLVLAEATARAPGAAQAGARAVLAHLAGIGALEDEALAAVAAAVDALPREVATAAARQAEQAFPSQQAVLAASRHTALGRQARTEALAAALRDRVGVEAAAERYVEHREVPEEAAAGVALVVRLARWLNEENIHEFRDFAGLARWYVEVGGFVDRARQGALARLQGTALMPAVRGLLDAVKQRREAVNRAFAGRMRSWGRQTGQGLVPVEQVVAQVVAPLAARQPVLLLVLDGLSFAVAHELAEDLPAGQWVRVQAPGEAVAAVATLPSVTELARTALLTGQVARGGQTQERSGFADHPALRDRGRRPPRVFHEADLRVAGGELAVALASPEQAVVAVVVNAVDKELSGSSQYIRAWKLSNISGLRALLDAARDAGRVVVLTADHGHVWFDQPVTRPSEGGGRWRVGQDAGPDEVAVATPDGPRVVPVVEDLRYQPSAGAGTHGGATPQEVLVPLWVLWPASLPEVPPSAPVERPRFWSPEARPAPVRAVEAGTAGLPLFEVAAPVATGPLARALRSSPLLADRLKLVGRAISADQVLQLVEVLEHHGGRLSLDQLSARLGVGVPRLRGLASMAMRALNVDGFQVLTLDNEEGALRLAPDLVRAQFGLEG